MRWLDQLPRVISEVIRGELVSSSKVILDRNESFAASQNRSYTTLFSYQRRQENKAKLACLANEYQFWFCSQLCLYISLCAFSSNGAKNACWRLPTSPSDDARRRKFGTAVLWTTNRSVSARNTAVAFYPGVYRGVIYISTGKTMSERIYKSVGELYLDWIFSCINMGKIITW